MIPAALHNQIGEAEARAMNVSVVVEGANGPTTTEGDAILFERGIDVIPDILANAGGVTVSYYEWVQNRLQEKWDLEEVDTQLEKAMKRAYRRAYEFARERKCTLRDASYALSLQRLALVYAARGIFP
jgi:glutamate dehydrogenase (NAD(P)+)